MQYDIYISYKRLSVSSTTAAFLYEFLRNKGYTVFFDRRTIRQGNFVNQLFENIQNASDVIVLLEKTSLNSCYKDSKDAYKTDWFCMEIMEALKKGKRIIPILLDGFNMPRKEELPSDLCALSEEHAITIDCSDIDHFYDSELIGKGYLLSKPRHIILSKNDDSNCIADFLFYSDADCDITEYGNLIVSLDDNIDMEHPFRVPVKRAGEHIFIARNNDTAEHQTITASIGQAEQKYIHIKWGNKQNLWLLKKEEITAQKDLDTLYQWGVGLYEGTSKYKPNIGMSILCLRKCILSDHKKAIDFVKSHEFGLMTIQGASQQEAVEWYELSAQVGSFVAMDKLGEYFEDIDPEKSFYWYSKAASLGYATSQFNIALMYEEGRGTKKNATMAETWYRKAAESGDPRAKERVSAGTVS